MWFHSLFIFFAQNNFFSNTCSLYSFYYNLHSAISHFKKIKTKDKIKIVDDFLLINGEGIAFADIVNFRVEECKPKVVFFFNNRMVVFKEAIFHIKTRFDEFHFNVIGTEKIELLNQYLQNIVQR